jgi:hypothetical protein
MRHPLSRVLGALALLRRRPPPELCALPDLRLAAWQSAAVAAWWAFLLLMPFHLFATNPGFRDLAAAGPEWAWGLVMAALAAGTNAARRHRGAVWRALAVLVGTFCWGFLAVYLALPAPHWPWRWGPVPVNTGVGAYSLALACGCARALVALVPFVMADLYAAWTLAGIPPSGPGGTTHV